MFILMSKIGIIVAVGCVVLYLRVN